MVRHILAVTLHSVFAAAGILAFALLSACVAVSLVRRLSEAFAGLW